MAHDEGRRSLNHLAFFRFKEDYWRLPVDQKARVLENWLAGVAEGGGREPVTVLWGFTAASVYSKARSTQEIDPFAPARKRYLVVYPFAKTGPWYLKSTEARQGMMNEHIRLGKQFPEIHQLLLYSFGLQDHEFIVVYETDA